MARFSFLCSFPLSILSGAEADAAGPGDGAEEDGAGDVYNVDSAERHGGATEGHPGSGLHKG